MLNSKYKMSMYLLLIEIDIFFVVIYNVFIIEWSLFLVCKKLDYLSR